MAHQLQLGPDGLDPFPTVAALDRALNERIQMANTGAALDAALRLKLIFKRRLTELPDGIIELEAAVALGALDVLTGGARA
jgi:hypothetical protein